MPASRFPYPMSFRIWLTIARLLEEITTSTISVLTVAAHFVPVNTLRYGCGINPAAMKQRGMVEQFHTVKVFRPCIQETGRGDEMSVFVVHLRIRTGNFPTKPSIASLERFGEFF